MTAPVSAPSPDLSFPVGRYASQKEISPAQRTAWIEEVAALPANFRRAVAGLDDARLDTPYRPGGWTVRQVAHHVPESHMNAYVRFKLALTEESPTIKPYEEARWAELPDARRPIAPSLTLLDALHDRWVALMRLLTEEQWHRGYVHPEQGRLVPLDDALGLYAWHSRHHTAHVTRLRERMGW